MSPRTRATPHDGLGPRAGEPKRVVIIGAGIAGLVAAYELDRAGHEPIVLEANQRVGGRVYTLRGFAPGLYGEAGAMRIPRVHDLTLGYCERFGLKLRPFVMGNPKALVYVAGERMTAEQVETEPGRLRFDLEGAEVGRSFGALWDQAVADLRGLLEHDEDAGWEAIVRDYDQYSLREFLESRGWSEGAIEMYGVMNFVESDLDNSVIEEFRESLGKAFEDMQEIVGGMDLLPAAFYSPIQERVRFGAEVVGISQDPDGVIISYRTLAGRFAERADYAICTLPFSVLRHVEVTPRFSREKQRAVRQLNYSESTKILFQVRNRFWETEDGIVGGTTATDLPIRRIVYPSHPADDGGERAVLLASYTWSQDATRWARWIRSLASSRPSTTSPRSIHLSGVRSRAGSPRRGRPIRSPRVLSHSSPRVSRPSSRPISSNPRVEFTSPASTARCTMPGSREHSSLGSGPHSRFTPRRRDERRLAAYPRRP